MSVRRFMNGAALPVLALALASPAFAQSTGTQEVERVVVTGRTTTGTGLIVPETRPKTRSTITQEYLATQQSGQTVFQSLNLVPGLNFTNSDAYGSSGGNVRLRSFDGNRISVTQDGIPLNDTGNYAIFTNQQLDPEVISRATVNTGTTDVDSPTASATGGTINLQTRRPDEDAALRLSGAAGSWSYLRGFASVDTGEFASGTSMFFTGSRQEYDKFKGPGDLTKTQVNARVYQEIGENSFFSVLGHYNQNRNAFYRNLSRAQIAFYGRSFDNLAGCTRLAAVNGVAQNEGSTAIVNPAFLSAADNPANPGSCTNFWNVRINPSNTGNVRAQGSFKLSDSLTFTVDPSWQYVKANGGGWTAISETDRRLRGALVAPGVDLNGDTDFLDTIGLHTPNNTNTNRYGVNTSLIWDIDANSRLRAAYTLDWGRHRQTGAFGFLGADGKPRNPFAGLDGGQVFTADGNFLRGRDRLSYASLNQVALSYSGSFFEDTLRIDVGLRAPFFERDLDQRCFTQNGSSTVRCTTEPTAAVLANGNVTFTGLVPEFIPAFKTSVSYDAVLPNVGVSYEFLPKNIVYASFAESLSAPRTDSLYTARRNPVTFAIELSNAEPERTRAYDVGYRFQGDMFVASVAGWYTQYENRIVNSFDDLLGIFVDRNVGSVDLWGVDAEAGFEPIDNLALYASASYIQSELLNNVSVGAGLFLPTAGKELVETPEWTVGGRAEYTFDVVTFGFQGKFVGERWSTDVNDEIAEAYTTFDADVQVDLEPLGLGETLLQLNATNLFDEEFFGNIGTQTNALAVDVNPDPILVTNRAGSAPTYAIGAPQTFQFQIKTKF